MSSSGAAPPRPAPAGPRPVAAGREEGAQRLRIRHRGREADPPRRRREAAEPGEAERQLVAPLGAGQGMDLVHHHGAEPGEDSVAASGLDSSSAGFPAWSAECCGGCLPLALCGGSAACRRCGSRSGSARPSHRPGPSGCGRCRPPAPSAARHRACAGRGRGRARPGRSGSAGSRPASCRRRSGRSAGRISRPPRRVAKPAGGPAASSPAQQTRWQKVPAMFPCPATMAGPAPPVKRLAAG